MIGTAMIQSGDEPRERISRRVTEVRQSLSEQHIKTACNEISECAAAVEHMISVLESVDQRLLGVPPIDVAFLGPSRHGKSTLLNALAACNLLPTSDVKPCTASILRLRWAEEWSLKVRFVEKDQLMSEWQEAVQVAGEELRRLKKGGDAGDDPALIKSMLQRFVQLFHIDADLPPQELLEAVKQGRIPGEIASILGTERPARPTDADGMRQTVEKYLSTSDVFWTIVDSCEIQGPFEDWHHSLELCDLPGTNDTDPQRTAVTQGVRENATAVAIVTSDSNLGPDIESWLRNSTVLSNFLEATRERRQRLFVIRTKLDSYHPQIDFSDDMSEEEEIRVHQDAVDAYKREQEHSYHSMLRDITTPKLPTGDDDASRKKRSELLARIDEIPVFFVSALAHEVFEGRFQPGRRTKNNLIEYFNEDLGQTGIPGLRSFLNHVSEEYLSQNFYADLEAMLESEVRHLANTFQSSLASTKAELAGGRQSLVRLGHQVRDDLLPWLKEEVANRSRSFREISMVGATGLIHRMQQTTLMAERRFEDKMELWCNLHWASLRASARKDGVHVTSRGNFIDINRDICSVLIDDVVLTWTHFRDHLIQQQIDDVTQELTSQITQKLSELEQSNQIPEVAAAVENVKNQLTGITDRQRLELLRVVDEKIKQLESIQKPAYAIAQEEMSYVYDLVARESGAGCSDRMRNHLQREGPPIIKRIRERIHDLVSEAVSDLTESCTGAITVFGQSAADQIQKAISHVSDSVEERNERDLTRRLEVAGRALKTIPHSQQSP